MKRGVYNPENISLDRIDSSKGHIKDNVVISCLFCNLGRNCAVSEQWKEMVKVLTNKDIYQPDYSNEERYGKWASDLIYRCKIRHKKIDTNNEFNITLEWLKSQPLICYYTGIKLFPSVKNWYVFQPSLDRIDNNKGYTKDNVVLVSRGLNSARNQMDFYLFLLYIEQFKNK